MIFSLIQLGRVCTGDEYQEVGSLGIILEDGYHMELALYGLPVGEFPSASKVASLKKKEKKEKERKKSSSSGLTFPSICYLFYLPNFTAKLFVGLVGTHHATAPFSFTIHSPPLLSGHATPLK